MNDFSALGLTEAFPSLILERMVDALDISPNERVLDIGGGGAPLPRADVVVDRYLAAVADRDNLQATVDSRWLAGDVQALPFVDHTFDFAYCAHVLEHVNDPGRACEELMRVARRGYIETPRRLTEMLHGHPTHRWLVDVIDGVLVFERRMFIESPLHNVMLAHALTDEKIFQAYLVEQRHLSCVQFEWSGRFEYAVIEPPGWQNKFDYDNVEHAGWSHFFFALNLLAQQAPVSYVIGHIYQAKTSLPNESLPTLLACVIELLKGDFAHAKEMYNEACRLNCADPSLNELEALLLAPESVQKVPIPLDRGYVTRPFATVGNRSHTMLETQINELKSSLSQIQSSTSCCITCPLRALKPPFMKLFKSLKEWL